MPDLLFRFLYELARDAAGYSVGALRGSPVWVRRARPADMRRPGQPLIVSGADFVLHDSYSYRGSVLHGGNQLGFAVASEAGGVLLFTDAILERGLPVTLGPRTDRFVALLPGTAIAVPGGTCAVEDLVPGDLVCLDGGAVEPVRRIGRRQGAAVFADPLHVEPVRVVAGALGDGLPVRDLLLSPDCAVLLDGVLIQAGALVDDGSIRREPSGCQIVTYWQLELDAHALIVAEGVSVESFCDSAQLAMRPEDLDDASGADQFFAAEMDLPRAKSHRQVPYATRARLRSA